jgi:hypothetical protein
MSKSGPLPLAVTGTALWRAQPWPGNRLGRAVQRPVGSRPGRFGWSGPARGLRTSLRRENPFLPVRTRFFDDPLTAATWAEQIVLLGAGMGTRAYRLNLPTDTGVFEVDHPDIFTAKNVVLDGVTQVPAPGGPRRPRR